MRKFVIKQEVEIPISEEEYYKLLRETYLETDKPLHSYKVGDIVECVNGRVGVIKTTMSYLIEIGLYAHEKHSVKTTTVYFGEGAEDSPYNPVKVLSNF